MNWEKVRQAYPDRWVVLEAKAAHSAEGYRVIDEAEVVAVLEDAMEAFRRHAALQKQEPRREFYFFHTSRECLDIYEKKRAGLQKI
ncbi:hypothetical protein [Bacillus piscicola]|uniref:hypothetical protein n=1 Tax=Bacillus piscicola TaxID=1632684 RepID=UPI001F097BB5|nr:hypothetical protein [Bacillus piscicola]